jgi:hypothetical protein
MDNIDLNIQNYNYEELLSLFRIENCDDRDYMLYKIDNKLDKIKNNFPKNIYDFYHKGKMILITIYDILSSKIIKDNTEITTCLNKLHKIPNIEKFNETELYNKIITSEKSDDLNTPYYNVDTRINPSLNNKNNTNIVYNTAINEISPGDLNSVKRVTQLLNLNLNSCFRNNYYQSNPCDFLYILPTEINKVVSMRLVSIEIPNSWYLFSNVKKNNIFEIVIHYENKDYKYDIEVAEGNYNNETLQQYLNSTYFYESGIDNYLKYIKFTIDPHTLKSNFQFIESNNFENNQPILFFSLIFSQNINQNIMNTFGWILGFRLGNYLKLDNITSEGLFDAGGDRYIYVCINDFQYNSNNSNIVCFDKSILNEDVIAKIPMINGKLSLIINDNNNALAKIRRYNGPINLSRLQIKIIDHFGTIIDLNNMDFSMTVELEILYENFNFKNIVG